MTMNTVSGEDIAQMIDHWLHTPAWSYLGSNYGHDIASLLQRPNSEGAADDFLTKLRADVPIVTALPEGALSLYAVPDGLDRLSIHLGIGNRTYNLSDMG